MDDTKVDTFIIKSTSFRDVWLRAPQDL